MAKSILGIKHRGTGFPTAYRVIAAGSPTMIGTTFLTQRIGSVTGGPFVAGETVSHSAGAQTAVVTQVLTGRLILNSMSSGWAPGVGTITGGTSGATAAGAGVEGLEAAGSDHHTHSRVLQFQNQLFAFHYNTVYKFNQSTDNWEENYRLANLTAADANANSVCRVGLFIVAISGIPNLVAMHFDGTNIYRIKSGNAGGTWSEALLSANTWPTDGALAAFTHQNVVYVTKGLGINGHDSWDPSTDGYARVTNGFLGSGLAPFNVVWENRIFQIGQKNGVGIYRVTEFSAGSYINLLDISITTDNISFVKTKNTGFVGDDGIMRILLSSNATGYRFYKITFPAGVCTATEITGILPAAIQGTTGSVPNTGRIGSYVDDETNGLLGGPNLVFLWYAANDTAGTSRSYFEYIDDSTPMVTLSTGCPIEVALAETQTGGGERCWFPGELDVSFVGAPVPILGGERISFTVRKRPGTSDVTGVKFRLLYSTTGEAPNAFASLSNPSVAPSGPTLAISGGNEITGIVADDGTYVYTVDWLAVTTDGLTNFSQVVTVPLVHTS